MRDKKLYFVGCPLLARSRHRAVEWLDEKKADRVVGFLEELLVLHNPSDVIFLASDGAIVRHPLLREMVNPVFLLAQGKKAGEELDQSVEVLQLQIALPFEERTGCRMKIVSVIEKLGEDRIAMADKLAKKNSRLATDLYKTIAGPLSRVAPKFARANLIFGIALANFMETEEDSLLVDFLQYPQTWQFLERFLSREVGEGYKKKLVIAPDSVRQPWV